MTSSRPDPNAFTQAKFDALNTLCKEYRRVFDPDHSPPPELLNEFYTKLHNDAFVKVLFSAVGLKKAIQSLESNFSSKVFHSYEMDDNTKELKRREREVRFIHRFAKIMGAFGGGPDLPNVTESKRLQQELARAMRYMKNDIATLLGNEHFVASIPVRCTEDLYLIKALIINNLDYVAKARPVYPYIKATHVEGAKVRLLIDRLTDVCLRIYAHCDEKILLQLTSGKVAWFEKKEIKKEIALATERKVDAYNRRLPYHDSESVDLYGEWLPARTSDPSWW